MEGKEKKIIEKKRRGGWPVVVLGKTDDN